MRQMDIKDIRRENARALAEQVGGIKAFADRIDRNDALVSRYIGRGYAPRKPIGDRVARHIERCFLKPKGWLDTIHNGRTTVINAEVSTAPAVNNVEAGPELRGNCPLISWVAAGHWQTVVDIYSTGDAEQWYPCPVSHGPRTYVLRVKGASMEPRFREGELIFVDPDRDPENGDFVIVRLDDSDEATFKRLVIEGGETYLEALNPDWPNRYLRVTGEAVFCGVAIFKGETL